jgi:hypothetical protein
VKKAIPLIVLSLFLAAGAGVWWVLSSLNSLVANAIESHGSRLTGTHVAVDGVDIELGASRGAIDGMTIANPKGFSNEDAVSLGHASIRIDPGSVRSDPIGIESVTIGAPRLLVELDERGNANVQVLERHIASQRGADQAADARRMRIDTFRFEEGRVIVDATALGGERTERALPAVQLTNLGGTEGLYAPEIGREVLVALLDRASREAATDALRERLRDEFEDQGGDVGKAVGDLLGSLGD